MNSWFHEFHDFHEFQAFHEFHEIHDFHEFHEIHEFHEFHEIHECRDFHDFHEIHEFKDLSEIQPEIKFGKNSRFDFLVFKKKEKSFIEVKNVTLSRKDKVAEFPDAITTRGLKHINELVKASKKNYKIYILYLIQRDDCKSFTIASDIDPFYASALKKAVKKKLKILCYDCKFSLKGIKLNNKINLKT